MARRGGSRGRGRAVPGRMRAPPRAAPEAAAARPRADLSRTRLRWFAEHENLSAALLLALPVLAYLWPVLIGGQILSPIAGLYELPPWKAYAPSDLHSYLNFNLIDVPLADYPWRVFARESIRSGTLPLWNPHVFAGVPFFSNPQNGLFSPFNIPLWVLPLNYALGLSAALKLWVGALGTYLLVRQLRLGFLAGLLAGVTFAFSSLNIVWLTHETLPGVAVMLPWMVLFVERIFERGRLGSVIGLAVVTAIGLGGGHPGMQVHLLAVVGFYVLLRPAFAGGDEDGDRSVAERLRPVGLALGGMVMGTLLMSVMLVPELLSSRETIGTIARRGGTGTLPGTQMPFEVVKTILFPDWWGRPSAFELPEEASAVIEATNFNERTFYAGVVALLFAIAGLLARGDWRREGPFAVLAAVGIAIPLHAPVLWWLVTHVPPFELVQNQRLYFVFAFGVAVLAAFGLQAMLDRPAEARRRLLVPLGAVVVGLIASVGAGAQVGDVGDVLTHFLTGKDFESAGVLALTSVGWFLLFAVGVGLVLLAAIRWPQRVGLLAVLVVLLASVDALHFAHGYQPMGPASKVIPPVTPTIAYLQKHAREGRITGLDYALSNDWALLYGLNDIRGYDPPYPTARYFRLWREANPEQTDWQTFTMRDLERGTVKVSSVLGARFIVAGPGTTAPGGGGALTRVYTGKDATIFRAEQAVPRAMVAPEVKVVGSEGAVRAALIAEDFDPRRTAVVESTGGGSAGAASLADGAPVRGTATVIDEQNARVTLHAALDRRGLVILNDQLTPGWSVRVDGQEADVVRVNDMMRGVVVPAGSHEVEWHYALPGLRAGFLLSLLAVVGLLGAAVVARRRTRG